MTEIFAITPVFSHSAASTHISATLQARPLFESLGRRETTNGESNNLLAVYVTENPERQYSDTPETFGRIVALVRLLPMPWNKTVLDYPSGCRELIRNQLADRWPVGWPCETVFYSPHGGPMLRDVVRSALRITNYGDDFACQMQHGPIDLMRFVYAPLRQQLISEVRHQIVLDPQTLVKPF